MRSKRYFGKVLFGEGESAILCVKAANETEARNQLYKNYRVDHVLKVSDTYIGIDNTLSYMGGNSVIRVGRGRKKSSFNGF